MNLWANVTLKESITQVFCLTCAVSVPQSYGMRERKKKEKYILKINKQLKRFCSLLLFLKFDFFPCFLWAVEQKCQSKREGGWCKRAWANGVKGGKAGVSVCVEVARRGGRGGERPRGCCYENSHKDRLNMIKGLAELCKNPTGRKKTKKNAPK